MVRNDFGEKIAYLGCVFVRHIISPVGLMSPIQCMGLMGYMGLMGPMGEGKFPLRRRCRLQHHPRFRIRNPQRQKFLYDELASLLIQLF